MFVKLDVTKNTKLEVTEYWKAVMGKEYQSSGVVSDVVGRKNMAEVRVVDRSRATLAGGYNMVLLMPDIDKASQLRKGEMIRYKGYLSSYRGGMRGGVVITLKDAEVSK